MAPRSRTQNWAKTCCSSALASLCLLLGLIMTANGETSPPMKPHRVYVPADVSSGVAFGRGEPRPYALRTRITPAYGFGEAGRVRVGVEAVGLYENPKWFFGLGPSASLRVCRFKKALSEVGVLAVLDHMWWRGERPSSGAALIFDLNGALRLGLRVDRDWLEESTIPQLTIGADIPTLLKLAGPQGSGEPHLDLDGSGGSHHE